MGMLKDTELHHTINELVESAKKKSVSKKKAKKKPTPKQREAAKRGFAGFLGGNMWFNNHDADGSDGGNGGGE